MTKTFVVPKKLKVGYVKRDSTTNGLLGYVVNYDLKTGLLKKEKSLESWRDKDIETTDFDNKPLSGFIFSSNICRSGFYHRGKIEKVRVFDPRGFDVEINIDNLMQIIEEYNIEKTEIKGELAYCWDGNEMFLIPTSSDSYKRSVDLSSKLSSSFSLRSLNVGEIYECKDSYSLSLRNFVYIGRFDVNDYITNCYSRSKNDIYATCYNTPIGKKHIFAEYNGDILSKYTIVNPKLVLRAIGNADDMDLNDAIIKFEKRFETKKFEQVIYLNTLKKSLFKDKDTFLENVKEGFLNDSKIFFRYGHFVGSGNTIFKNNGFEFSDNKHQTRMIPENDCFYNMLVDKIGEKEPTLENSIKSMLEVLSDIEENKLGLRRIRNIYFEKSYYQTVFQSYIKMNNLDDDSFAFSRLIYKFELDNRVIFESEEFKKYFQLADLELMKHIDIFYLSTFKSLDGHFYCYRNEETTDHIIDESFKLADIQEGKVWWIDDILKRGRDVFYTDPQCRVDKRTALAMLGVVKNIKS